jgi:hypothetical protein
MSDESTSPAQTFFRDDIFKRSDFGRAAQMNRQERDSHTNFAKRLTDLASKGDLFAIKELTQEKDWPKNYTFEKVITDYMCNHLLRVASHEEMYGVSKPGYIITDEDRNEKMENYRGLLNNNDIPLVAKIAGIDKFIDHIDTLLDNTSPDMASHAELTAIKKTIYTQQEQLLLQAPDLNSFSADVPLDISNAEQAAFYARAIDWSKPTIKLSLKGKLLHEIFNKIEKTQDYDSKLAEIALAAGHVGEQLSRLPEPQSLPDKVKDIFTKVGSALSDANTAQPLDILNLLLQEANTTSITFMNHISDKGQQRLQKNIAAMEPEQVANLVKTLKQLKLRIKGEMDQKEIRKKEAINKQTNAATKKEMQKKDAEETRQMVGTVTRLDDTVSKAALEDTKTANVVLPELLTGRPLAMGTQTIEQASLLRTYLSPEKKEQLDKSVVRGAVRAIQVEQAAGQVKSTVKLGFANYYAGISSQDSRDQIKVNLGEQENAKTAAIALNLMRTAQDHYSSKCDIFTQCALSIGDAVRGDRYTAGLKRKAKELVH